MAGILLDYVLLQGRNPIVSAISAVAIYSISECYVIVKYLIYRVL